MDVYTAGRSRCKSLLLYCQFNMFMMYSMYNYVTTTIMTHQWLFMYLELFDQVKLMYISLHGLNAFHKRKLSFNNVAMCCTLNMQSFTFALHTHHSQWYTSCISPSLQLQKKSLGSICQLQVSSPHFHYVSSLVKSQISSIFKFLFCLISLINHNLIYQHNNNVQFALKTLSTPFWFKPT